MINCGSQQRVAAALSALFVIVILAGCTAPMPPVHPAPEPLEIKAVSPPLHPPEPKGPLFFTHKVRWPGETLSHVSKWYTGSEKNWQRIASVNPALSPDHLVIGDIISIPMELVTSQRSMPRSYVLPSNPARQKSPISTPKPLTQPPPTKPSIQPPAPALFGPIDDTQPRSGSDETELFPPME